MNDKEFTHFTDELQKYLDANKTGTIKKARFAELQQLITTARELFPGMDVRFENDPLQLGRIIMCIEGYDITISGEDEIRAFAELIFNADNFEIYAKNDEKVEIAIMYGGYMDITIG